jgi:hypothetical protein
MPELSELIREYSGLVMQESRISERKSTLRTAISDEMARRNLKSTTTDFCRVSRTERLKLLPRADAVLGVLTREDLLSFATFTPPRVNEVLVPKYGRDTLARLFEIEKTEALVIKWARDSSQAASDGRPAIERGDGLAAIEL